MVAMEFKTCRSGRIGGAAAPGLLISDRYAGQLGWAKREQQVRLAHLIRDVQYAIEAGDTNLAPGLKGLLKRAWAIGRRRPDLADSTLKTDRADLDRRLDRLMALVPSGPPGKKLHRMIRKVRRHLFVFVTNRDIEATNNGSERALRPCAVCRKITNGFRSDWGATLYANIRSVDPGSHFELQDYNMVRFDWIKRNRDHAPVVELRALMRACQLIDFKSLM